MNKLTVDISLDLPRHTESDIIFALPDDVARRLGVQVLIQRGRGDYGPYLRVWYSETGTTSDRLETK